MIIGNTEKTDETGGKSSPVLVFDTGTPEETGRIAGILGSLISSRMVIGLDGELGAGKTEFVKGLAQGAGIPKGSYITSPTYSIINQYTGRLPLYHLDLYRLSGPEELHDTGIDDILSENAIIVVEWPSIMLEISDLDIRIEIQITGITDRKLSFFAYGLANSNLLRELANQFKERDYSWD